MCDGSFRSELLLPREQTSTWHITQVYYLNQVCAYSRDTVETWVTDDEIACAWKPVIKGLLLDEHYGVDFSSMLNTGGFARRDTLGCCAQPLHIQCKWMHDFTMMWGAGSCCAIKALPVFSSPSRMKLIWAFFLHLQMHTDLKLPRPAVMWEMCCTVVFTYNLSKPREEAAFSWSQRSVVSCERDKLMMSTHALYACVHAHACKVCSQTRRDSASHHQWHKPSVAVFRLGRALLIQRVPYNATHFHFHPRTAAPPFCSSHLHRSLCTHNM